MAYLDLGDGEGLTYRHEPPTRDSGRTFVFFNALTGDLGLWDAHIAPTLREAGHGTLLWNLRGQADSPFRADRPLDAAATVADTQALLSACKPARPVFVGLSIGGLYAARAWLAGAPADGLVLINTLRRDGARLRWINDALLRCVQVGGLRLLRDLFAPRLFGEAWLAANRQAFLTDEAYEPLDPEHGHYRLLDDSRSTDWDLPYESLTLPVRIITGLEDGLFLDHRDVDRLFVRLPHATRTDLPDAGHMLPAEQPAWLAGELEQIAETL